MGGSFSSSIWTNLKKGAQVMEPPQILIVEDQAVIALDLKNRLRLLGFNVSGIANTANQAIQIAVETRPNLILMDIGLRDEMDGIQAAEHIRTHLDVPILYLTAYTDEETLQRALKTEASGFLLKPFDEQELQYAIESILGTDGL
jgi:CheY-like chemotaxis protein